VCIAAVVYDCVISYSVTLLAVICPLSPNDRNAAHWLARVITSDRAPTKMRLKAQVVSRLNQLRDTNLRPRWRVDQPCQEAAGGDHRDGMDDGNQDSHTETSIDKGATTVV
jgi:hypothetical protein